MIPKPLYFIDFEASSLSFDSYPIEVAWGSTTAPIESFLINPTEIDAWSDWSEESEAVHNISYETLLLEGQSPKLVCDKLTQALDSVQVYSDAPSFDMDWLRKLYDAADATLPDIKIQDLDELLIAEMSSDDQTVFGLSERLDEFKTDARNKVPGQHRAAWDVEYMIALWTMVSVTH